MMCEPACCIFLSFFHKGVMPSGGQDGAQHALEGGLRARLAQYLVTRCDPPQLVTCGTADDACSSGTAGTGDGRRLLVMNLDVLQLLDACWELTDPLMSSNTMGTLEVLKSEVLNLFHGNGAPSSHEGKVGLPMLIRNAPNLEVSLRLTHVPPTAGPRGASLKQCCGCLVSLSGTMVRVTGKRVVPASSIYRCGKCGNNSTIVSDPFHRGDARKPRCEEKSCKGEVLQLISQSWMDYAECRLQQRLETTGRMPRSVLVALDDDLTTKCTVGQLVEVVGVVKERWKNVFANATPSVEIVVWALNITAMDASRQASARDGEGTETTVFHPESVAEAYNLERGGAAAESILRAHLLQSTCPQLSGVFGPRLGLLLAAVDGAWTHAAAGEAHASLRIRSTMHMLLVGDPSTGKSQLLRFAALIAPRSTSTTGVTTTSAGLTVAATKEMGEWVLEPGALVLSDGGTCCIDELRTVSAADRTSLHEAMEQQTISVAKAGLVTRLRTVCSVVAACNPPMNRRNPYGHLNVEIGVGGPLLSRFDMIFLMWDDAGSSRDVDVASHILECSAAPPIPPLSTSHIARYLSFLRARYTAAKGPDLGEDAARMIGHYFECVRRRGPTPALCDAVPVTVRFLESLIRCTQAHAKLVQHELCGWRDASMGIFLMERSAHGLKFPLPIADQQLVASVKVALHIEDDKELFSSSKWLDEVFLSDIHDAVRLQEQVLSAIRDRYSSESTSVSQSAENAPLLGDTVELLTMVTKEDLPSPTGRKRSRSFSSQDAFNRRSSSASSPIHPSEPLTERSVATYDTRAFTPPSPGITTHQQITREVTPSWSQDADALEFPDEVLERHVAPRDNAAGSQQPAEPARKLVRTPQEVLQQLAFKGFGAHR